jgi:hypothetical protein
MRKIFIAVILLFISAFSISAQSKWSGNESPTYDELHLTLKQLASKNKEVELYNMGNSDYGLPIYVCFVNGAGDSTKTFAKARNETTILINNAIHPGEPDGVNAMLLWLEEWIKAGKKTKDLPVIAFIPAYNVGGMMNRSSTSRANQNGPEEYGFRGNARNLDLNRDFIKMDAENTFTFARIFHSLDPDVFVDNHVSNGADYQYTLTYISSLKERLAPSIQRLTYEKLIPELKSQLQKRGTDLFPYVELKGETPAEGIVAFNDLPRYAMGYASLFHSLSFTVETHMLKPFPERVQVTKQFMEELTKWTFDNKKAIELSRKSARGWEKNLNFFKFNYKISEQKDTILFKGFEHSFPINETTNLKRLFYDRSKPYKRNIPYYCYAIVQDSVLVPAFYVVGAQEKATINRLLANNIKFQTLKSDSLIELTVSVVADFKSNSKPYEGHFKHREIQIKQKTLEMKLKKGDIIIPSKQQGAFFIHSVLQSRAEDSYLSWNFYDSYLQQKEYFSNYVFIDQIEEILKANPTLKATFEAKKETDSTFRNSEWEQLYFIYSNSPYFEQTFMRLPVYEKFN